MVGTTKGAVSSRSIGHTLRTRREALVPPVSVRELARRLKRIGVSIDHTKLSRIENGQSQANPEVLAKICAQIGMSSAEIGDLLADASSTDGVQWISTKRIPRGTQLQALRAFESRATSIVSVLPTLIPGWMQTPAYTQAIMRAAGLPDWEVEERLKVRADRAKILIQRHNPTRLEVFIGEEALRRLIGGPEEGPELMQEQLLELLAWADPGRANISIQVIPRTAGWFPGLVGGFMVLNIDGAPIVHIEHITTGQFLSDRADVDEFLKGVDKVRELALSRDESRDMIAHIAQLHNETGSEHVA